MLKNWICSLPAQLTYSVFTLLVVLVTETVLFFNILQFIPDFDAKYPMLISEIPHCEIASMAGLNHTLTIPFFSSFFVALSLDYGVESDDDMWTNTNANNVNFNAKPRKSILKSTPE